MIEIESFSFLFLILISYLLVRFGFDSKAFDHLPKILFTLSYPALVLLAFSTIDSDLYPHHIVFTVIFTVIATVLLFLLPYFALRRYRKADRKEIIIFYTMVGNVTFVGLPFIFYFFGAFGISFAIFFGMIQDLFIWSLTYARFSRRGSWKHTLKSLLNPCFLALIAGLILAFTPLSLPGFSMLPLELLADLTIPLALLCIGSLLAQNRDAIKHIDRDVVFSVVVKTFLIPGITFVVLHIIGIERDLALLSSFILSLPAPLLSILFAKQFDKDTAFANTLFVFSVLIFVLACGVIFLLQTGGIIPRIT